MKIVTVRSQIESVAEEWRCSLLGPHSHPSQKAWSLPMHEEVYNRLMALDTATATPADVAAIIGNDTWIDDPPECKNCGQGSAAVVEFDNTEGDPEVYRLCATCLQAALDGVKAAGGRHANDRVLPGLPLVDA